MMHSYSRITGNGLGAPSPPSSPLRSPRLRRAKGGRFQWGQPRTMFQRLSYAVLSLFLRRQGVFLFAPIIYISIMLIYMGTISIDVVPIVRARPPRGSIYRSPELYAKLRPFMDADNPSSPSDVELEFHIDEHYALQLCARDSNIDASLMKITKVYQELFLRQENHKINAVECETSPVGWSSRRRLLSFEIIWKHPYKGGEWKPCVNRSSAGLPDSNGFIYVDANGGLNQQRTSIGNAVAVAGFLNATLVIPNFHYHSIWRDPSKFKDIYDEDHFINTLLNDVRVVNKLPDYIMERFDHNMSNVLNFKVKAWTPIQYYEDEVLPKLLEEQVIRMTPFANRLSWDCPPEVQRLRCLGNFEALKFSQPIASLADMLVARMKERSANSKGRYVAVHLRFEEDMVAFSCCVYDGGEQEIQEMNAARERGWRGKFTRPGRIILPGTIRLEGKCPLTPLEVGLMLRGMGFGNNTSIYLASGKIYKAEKNMAPLIEMFPLLQTKETLASAEELAPFKNYSSRMAAIDYSVCLHSEVFVTTQGGNFPHFLMGHRRYLYGGHAKTIRPDKKKLALIFDNPHIGWRSFKLKLLNMRVHSDLKGVEQKRRNDSIYTFPCPDCMCRSDKPADLRTLTAS